MGAPNTDELAVLQSLADRGDKVADLLMRAFDVHGIIPNDISFTFGDEASHHRDVTIQVTDPTGAPLETTALVTVWLSDSAGAPATSTPPSGGMSVQAGALIAVLTTGIAIQVLAGAGMATIRITESSAKSFIVNAACGGISAASSALAFAG